MISMMETSKESLIPKILLLLFCFLGGALVSVLADAPPDADSGWPRDLDAGGFHIVVYQPQVDQLKKDHLQARAAITVTRSGESAAQYGIVSLMARIDVDKESRMVML